MRQVLGRCKASKADDVVAYFKAFATGKKQNDKKPNIRCIDNSSKP
jgi:hypothetical protein